MRGTGGIARQRWSRAGLIAAAGALLGGIAVAGTNDGNPAQDVRLRSGAAWLSSAKVGQVTLLDGSSAEVSAQVQVAPSGNVLDVVQQGSTAYAIDQTAGTVRRVDGATFDLTPPESPIPDAHAGLTALPGPDALYTLDSRRGILANTDPRTLARRGELLSLASELSTGTATVDEAGTLWAIDTTTGDLARVAGGKRSTRPQVAQPGPSILTIVGGHPVVVDTTARKAISIDRTTGKPAGSLDLDLRKDDTVQISGSPHAERLYVVVGRGNLSICDLPSGHCGSTIPLTAGNKFGAAVEAGNRLFVPDHTTGQVWIVDLTDSRVIAKPTVLTPAGPFQLLTRDGVVFYNDPNSTQAGVIHLDGTLSKAVKYDASDPNKGVQSPDSKPSQPQQPPSNPQQPPPNNPQQPNPPINQPNNPQQPPPNNPTNPPPTNPQQPDPNNPPQPNLEIVVSNATPTVDQPITLQVKNTTGPVPAEATVEWTFGDGETGGGITTSHKWAAAKQTPYNVTVKVTFPGGKTAIASVSITVSEKPTVKLTVTVPGGGGAITGPNTINCTTTCDYNLAPDTQVTLTAQPAAGHQLGTWGGACSGSAATCDVTLNTAKTVSYTFTTPDPTATLTVTRPADGTIAGGGINCGTVCTSTVRKGNTIQLTATPNQHFEFGGWGGSCAGQANPCSLAMNADANVTATFNQKMFNLTVRIEPHPSGSVSGPGVQCIDPVCVVPIASGTNLSLRASGVAIGPVRSYFIEWRDACAGQPADCTVLIDSDKTVTAIFRVEIF